MNIKLSTGEVAFKISESELSDLLEGRSILLRLETGPYILAGEIRPDNDRAQLALDLAPKENGLCIGLGAPSSVLRTLAQMGKNREGISFQAGAIKIVLQVDVRTDTRPRGGTT